ncbi:hypothetical protein KP509_28G049100 [Ceratopteris richardii]|uniref:Uncharacterized protein n=1 Tax=Ceratopteris richardii TaxID=49495 RepID=A0A8T2RDR6_CERRI|nr:hypothetical protein KP509_28G049100 [Ceratopteris richardii]KAH7293938.1 hypothetical protein KP509_28G049100 [Ceratopteris richardii]
MVSNLYATHLLKINHNGSWIQLTGTFVKSIAWAFNYPGRLWFISISLACQHISGLSAYLYLRSSFVA